MTWNLTSDHTVTHVQYMVLGRKRIFAVFRAKVAAVSFSSVAELTVLPQIRLLVLGGGTSRRGKEKGKVSREPGFYCGYTPEKKS